MRTLDATGRVVASETFVLEPRTQIDDTGGRMKELLRVARKTLERPNDSGTPTGVGTLEWRGETFHYYVPWLRDHVHTMKGMKYFDGQGSSFIDFFRETQKENGMIWDFFDRGQLPSFYETAYGPLGYARRYDGVELVRMPAEADVEYLFVEGLYYAWKSNADDAWMKRQLDAAVRAMDYSFTDRARFSTKYGLVKRGYTIDTWDFQVDDATTTSIFPRWGTLLVDPDRSKFGVMFGDNTGYAAACGYLAEMLERAGRPQDAARFREQGEGRSRAARPPELAGHALPALGAGGRDGRARRRRRRERSRCRSRTPTPSTAASRTSRRRRSCARTRSSAAPCRPARRASGTRSIRRSRRASPTTPRPGST